MCTNVLSCVFGQFWVSPKGPGNFAGSASYRDLLSSDSGTSGILERFSEQTSADPEIGSKSEIWSSDLESPAPPSSAQLSSAQLRPAELSPGQLGARILGSQGSTRGSPGRTPRISSPAQANPAQLRRLLKKLEKHRAAWGCSFYQRNILLATTFSSWAYPGSF